MTTTTTTNSNSRKTGRALRCLNAEYTDLDFRKHIMDTVYVRASVAVVVIIVITALVSITQCCIYSDEL
jgi:hypothetical protein